MAKRWCWAACLLLTIVCLVAQAEVARCQDDLEQTVDRVCRRIPPENKARKLECRAVVIMSMDSHNDDSLKTALKMLKQAQAIAPNDLSILNNTAFCYVKQKKYETALSILENSLSRQPDNLGVKNFTCMLKERLGYPRSEYRACYHSVVQAIKEKKMAKGINYVITVLVADEPDAQAIRDQFIAAMDPKDKSAASWKKALENFNRDEYIRKHLP
ncbi:MAG: tetratricopeptide repeat protein [Deltaproteobacteria bacterium]|nr:tetratricopeptide repeat protein [Deltaproteobacteria bacterium]